MSHDLADISSFFCDRSDQRAIESAKLTCRERTESFNLIVARSPPIQFIEHIFHLLRLAGLAGVGTRVPRVPRPFPLPAAEQTLGHLFGGQREDEMVTPGTVDVVQGLNYPYTYSDMTGFGLSQVGAPSG